MDFELFAQPNQLQTESELPFIVDVPQPAPEDHRKQIKHSVVFPPGDMSALDAPDLSRPIFRLDPPKTMAKTYPFELDPFYLKSIAALERGESILVSAHTSAGKTAVAEYAIALALARHQKIAYTSPIKALSNYKFRDLALIYHNSVGLMTGDSTVNRNAQIVVMTTEILRNMLQQGAEMLRELGCVIFDEVHYMRNAERGVVWEDCIAQIDSRAVFVFLSATIPNATEFAGWVSFIHRKPLHVIYTEYRPVPLQFCICPVGGREVFQVFTSDTRQVNALNVEKARRSLPFYGGKQGGMSGKVKAKLVNETILDCLKMLQSKQILPVIVFSFGKAKCEELAQLTVHQLNTNALLTTQQVETVDMIFDAALKEVAEEDRGMKQIAASRSLLRQGIGVHHSGLLPFVKEITEILFQEDLVKIIFVTETFAMGLNLPARCVVFTDMQKYDGQNTRYLQSGEYIQMAGRSGRRGKDTQGLVISFFSSQEDCTKSLQVMQGGAEPLNSEYRLGYCQLLNYLRVEGFSAQDAVSRSFLQFQRDFRVPKCAAVLERIDVELLRYEHEISSQCSVPLDELLAYMDVESVLFAEEARLMEMQSSPDFQTVFSTNFKRGRIVEIAGDDQYLGFAVAVACEKQGPETVIDCIFPGYAPAEYNTKQNSAQPALVLRPNQKTRFSASGERSAQLMQDPALMSQVQHSKTAELLNDVLEERTPGEQLGLLSGAEHICFDEYSRLQSAKTTITRADIFRLILQRAGVTSDSPLSAETPAEPILVRVPLSCLRSMRSIYIKHVPTSLQHYDDRRDVMRRLQATICELWSRCDKKTDAEKFLFYQEIVPFFAFDQLPNIASKYVEQQARVQRLKAILRDDFTQAHAFFAGHNSKRCVDAAPLLAEILALKRQQFRLNNELKSGTCVLAADLSQKQQLLKDLCYFDFEHRKTLEKGKIASAINAVNEIIMTEALFQGVLASQPPTVICGFVGALLGERIKQGDFEVNPLLAGPLSKLKSLVQELLDKCALLNIELDQGMTKAEDVIDLESAQAAFLWASGASLQEILDEIPRYFEGNLVRNFRRLVTALQQVAEATNGWADGAMAAQCAQAAILVNRGIVKADSLYIVEEQE